MVAYDNAKFLFAEENHFTADGDRDVTFYKLGFIPESDHKPLSMTCSEDVYIAAKVLAAYDDVMVGVEIFENGRYIKTRVTYLGAPTSQDA